MWGKIMKKIFEWLDVISLMAGIVFVAIGTFQIYTPAGFIVLGGCFSALAFLIAKKQASGR